MTRKVHALGAGILMFAFATVAFADCVCADAKTKDGWCGDCKHGYVAGVKINNDKLFAAVQGKDVSADKLDDCCKTAFAKDGACCGQTFTAGKAYTSPIAARLAAGEVVNMKDVKCAGCQAAAKSDGYCKDCGGGMVAGRVFKGEEAHKQAATAHGVLVKAGKASEKCIGCALAMVNNAECTDCKVSFKDGKMTKK